MIMLCNFAAASIPAMEENSIIRDLVRTYAENNMIMPTPEEEPITHRVLTLDTDTEGNA